MISGKIYIIYHSSYKLSNAKRESVLVEMAKVAPKDVCAFFYEARKEEERDLWRCLKCNKKKVKNGGWTNLTTHLKTCVGPIEQASDKG